MSFLHLTTLAALAINTITTATAQTTDNNDALTNLCNPTDPTTNAPDWSAPCNALASIQYECMYGRNGRDLIGDNNIYHYPEMQPPQAQRACICQSQHNDMLSGCMRCLQGHGGVEGTDWFAQSKYGPLMEAYCDAERPATGNYAYVFYGELVGVDDGDQTAAFSPSSSSSSSLPSTSDPLLANITDVSLYFTPSITGTPAYIPALPTPRSSGGNVTFTSLETSGGLIVATARPDGDDESGSEGEGGGKDGARGTATSSESEGGGLPAITARAEVVGAVGLAALFAVF